MTPAQFRKVAIQAAVSSQSKKAEDILLLDLRKAPSSISDFILILSANSQPHMEAIEQNLLETFDRMGLNPVHKDGARSEHWKVLDYGGLLVHIFHEKYRDFFCLERLYEEAKEIRWKQKRLKGR